MRAIWITFLLAFALFAVMLWAGDQVTLQGERTVHSVTCEAGTWNGLRCTGRLVAGERYRFRASRSRNEVLFWIAGSNTPSGKYTDCKVKDRDNWTCYAASGQPPSITHELFHGRPKVRGSEILVPFRAVAKWKWWALNWGLASFNEADYGNIPGSPPPPK